MDTAHEVNQIVSQVKYAAARKSSKTREQLFTLAKNQLPELPPAEYERAVKRIVEALRL